ncbi:MAG: cytochrome c-type biogenesis protein CcmH [Acidobacteria bacterium]|nr:cytochrome c-type biogenesis protein CcmH [Acidobacteriota bacterium]
MRPRFVLFVALYLVLAGVASTAQGQNVTREQVKAITSNLVCLCGCGNKTVSVCGCSTADATTREVEQMLREGKTADQIFAHYVNARGDISVLAAPPKKGFNLLVWVLPFLGIFVAGIFLVAKARHWQADTDKREATLTAESARANPSDSADVYRERLTKELEKID